jgi:hypothetical protein
VFVLGDFFGYAGGNCELSTCFNAQGPSQSLATRRLVPGDRPLHVSRRKAPRRALLRETSETPDTFFVEFQISKHKGYELPLATDILRRKRIRFNAQSPSESLATHSLL